MIHLYILPEDTRGQSTIQVIIKRLIECQIQNQCKERIVVRRPQKFRGPCSQASKQQIRALKAQARQYDTKPVILVLLDTDVYPEINEAKERVCKHVPEECRNGIVHVIPVDCNLEYVLCEILVAANMVSGKCVCGHSSDVLSRLLDKPYEKSLADKLAQHVSKALGDCRTVSKLTSRLTMLRTILTLLNSICAD